jgi:hypothetical protein
MAAFTRVYVECRPAYGRSYVSFEKCMEDWEAGKDFQDLLSGQYFSIRDLAYMQETMKTDSIGFRFGLHAAAMLHIINL